MNEEFSNVDDSTVSYIACGHCTVCNGKVYKNCTIGCFKPIKPAVCYVLSCGPRICKCASICGFNRKPKTEFEIELEVAIEFCGSVCSGKVRMNGFPGFRCSERCVGFKSIVKSRSKLN